MNIKFCLYLKPTITNSHAYPSFDLTLHFTFIRKHFKELALRIELRCWLLKLLSEKKICFWSWILNFIYFIIFLSSFFVRFFCSCSSITIILIFSQSLEIYEFWYHKKIRNYLLNAEEWEIKNIKLKQKKNNNIKFFLLL